jgi:hypothetical protein
VSKPARARRRASRRQEARIRGLERKVARLTREVVAAVVHLLDEYQPLDPDTAQKRKH